MRIVVLAALAACLAMAQPTKAPVDLYAHFDTSMGEIVAILYRDTAPKAVDNFVALAEGRKQTYDKDSRKVTRPYYNGLTFHRVVKGFMIQAGVVKPGLPCGVPNLKDELATTHDFAKPGALAMANAGKPNSASCQFFITVVPQKGLEKDYTLFGQVVSGQDIADRISEVPVKGERPITSVIIRKVTIERRAK